MHHRTKSAPSCPDECFEKAPVITHLGMPLDAEDEGGFWVFAHFDRAVGCVTSNPQRARISYGLMVAGIDRGRGDIENPRDQGAFDESGTVLDELPWRDTMCEPEPRRGQILDEASAALDRHYLEATAHAQHGQTAGARTSIERALGGIAFESRLVDGLVRRLSIVSGIDIGSARNHYAIKGIQHCADTVEVWRGRYKHYGCTRRLKGVDVLPRQQRCRVVPRAPLRGFAVAGDTNDGTTHVPIIPDRG